MSLISLPKEHGVLRKEQAKTHRVVRESFNLNLSQQEVAVMA